MKNAASGPRPLSEALSELIALKGLARSRGEAQLASIWTEVAGSSISKQTRVVGIKRGVLEVGVANSSMLNELVGFHKRSLLETLQERYEYLKIRDLKFRLNSVSRR